MKKQMVFELPLFAAFLIGAILVASCGEDGGETAGGDKIVFTQGVKGSIQITDYDIEKGTKTIAFDDSPPMGSSCQMYAPQASYGIASVSTGFEFGVSGYKGPGTYDGETNYFLFDKCLVTIDTTEKSGSFSCTCDTSRPGCRSTSSLTGTFECKGEFKPV